MVYLDILVGFSLVMLVFASAVSVAQTMLKRLFAIKGTALSRPLLAEVERLWRESPSLMALGRERWETVRRRLDRSLRHRSAPLGRALRTVAVADGRSVMRVLREEGWRAMAEVDATGREAWAALASRMEAGWGSLAVRLATSYEIHTRRWVLGIALVAVLVFNVDAIRMLRVLSVSSSTRAELAAVANGADPSGRKPLPANLSDWQKENFAELAATGLPLGWDHAPLGICVHPGGEVEGRLWSRPCSFAPDPRLSLLWTIWLWVARLLGLLVGAGLIAQGAPFWYAVLDSVFGIKRSKGGGKRDQEEEGEGNAEADAEPEAEASSAAVGAEPETIRSSPYSSPYVK